MDYCAIFDPLTKQKKITIKWTEITEKAGLEENIKIAKNVVYSTSVPQMDKLNINVRTIFAAMTMIFIKIITNIPVSFPSIW